MTNSGQIIEALRFENSILREHLLQAREALLGVDDWIWPLNFKLSGQAVLLLRLLYKQYPKICNKEMTYYAFYGNRIDEWPDIRIIDVRICQIRKRLSPGSIETIWGRGYKLSAKGKKWIDAQIRKQHNGKS